MNRSFNKEIGFDDEDIKSKLEIPYLKGEFKLNNKSLKKYSKPNKLRTEESEIKKILFKFPILNSYHLDKKVLDSDISVFIFYATSLNSVNGDQFYTQFSIAFDGEIYFINFIFRNLLDYQNKDKWVSNDFNFNKIEDVYILVESFLKVSIRLGVINEIDLANPTFNN